MKPVFRNIALALATVAALNPAQAGVLTFQDVVFTTTWANNVLTLEIDAGQHSGNWAGATTIGALSLKDIGSFQGVKVTAAPKGVEAWKMTARELTANGCSGGSGRNRDKTSLCLTGTPVALTDNMVFTFAFTGTPSLAEPHLKVNFFDGSDNKVGDLLSQTIVSAPVLVTPPLTPTVPETVPPAGNPVVDTPIPLPPTVTVAQPVLELEPELATAAGSEVPEPRTFALLLGGLALMGLALRKRN